MDFKAPIKIEVKFSSGRRKRPNVSATDIFTLRMKRLACSAV